MRNLLRRDRDNLERRLRDERPVPSDDLVRRLSGSTDARRSPRRRFGLVVALTSMIVVAFALTGGIGYAASSASEGAQAVKQLVTGSPAADTARSSGGSQSQSEENEGKSVPAGNESSVQTSSTDRGSARRQYQETVLICHKPRRNGGNTIRVSQSAVPAHLAHGDYLGPCRTET